VVTRRTDFPECEMEAAAAAIVTKGAETVGSVSVFGADVPIWRSSVNQKPGFVAFWVGTLEGEVSRIFAYRIAEEIELPNERPALEMDRAWVFPKLRGQGLSSALLRAMATCERKPLLTDRDGVTSSGYQVWEKSAGWTRSYWDQDEHRVVSEDVPPETSRFSNAESASRWVLILELPPDIAPCPSNEGPPRTSQQ
jgi:GNAT superfamily N-acetyltransferase